MLSFLFLKFSHHKIHFFLPNRCVSKLTHTFLIAKSLESLSPLHLLPPTPFSPPFSPPISPPPFPPLFLLSLLSLPFPLPSPTSTAMSLPCLRWILEPPMRIWIMHALLMLLCICVLLLIVRDLVSLFYRLYCNEYNMILSIIIWYL